MDFPATNKIERVPVEDQVESNAEILQEHLKSINWRFLFKMGVKVIGFIGAALFYLIFMIRLALWIFE